MWDWCWTAFCVCTNSSSACKLALQLCSKCQSFKSFTWRKYRVFAQSPANSHLAGFTRNKRSCPKCTGWASVSVPPQAKEFAGSSNAWGRCGLPYFWSVWTKSVRNICSPRPKMSKNAVGLCNIHSPCAGHWIGLDSLFSQGKPLANGYYTSHPENCTGEKRMKWMEKKIQPCRLR